MEKVSDELFEDYGGISGVELDLVYNGGVDSHHEM